MKTGKEILFKWLQDYYALKADSTYRDGTIVPTWFAEPAHIGLEGLIDEALREARQEGIDGKKQNTVMKDAGEHGPYWKEFFLKGCLDLPGVAEAFNCKREESIWRDQWQEMIRVGFKKLTLRSVDPIEFIESVACGMNDRDWEELKRRHNLILTELSSLSELRASAPVSNGDYKAPWS